MSKTDDLIQHLSQDLKPVKKMRSPEVRALGWILIGFSYSATLPLFLQFRYEISDKTTEPIFILELIVATLGSILACLSASYMSVPDSYQKAHIKWLSLIPFVALTSILVIELINQSKTTVQINTTNNTYECFLDMLTFAVFPIFVMLFLARKGASTNQAWVGAMIGLSAVNFSYIALRLIESNDEAKHILLWHYIPMILTVLVGAYLGRKFLKW